MVNMKTRGRMMIIICTCIIVVIAIIGMFQIMDKNYSLAIANYILVSVNVYNVRMLYTSHKKAYKMK